MVCTKCGRELAADARFCSNCGEAAPLPGINVRQDVGTVSGTVTGLTVGQGALPSGATVQTDQKIHTVDAGGTVAGVVLGGTGQTNVGGQHHHGDIVQGNKSSGDTISVGAISGNTGIAIGRNAQSNVNTTQASSHQADPRAELEQLLIQLQTLLPSEPATQTSEAEAVAVLAKQAVDLALSAQPNKMMVQFSINGLQQAAHNLATVRPTAQQIAELVEQLTR